MLVASTQSQHTGLGRSHGRRHDHARGGQAFFVDGTNRAMFRFTLLNHMCVDLEQVQDVSLPPDRIRQDVSRPPVATAACSSTTASAATRHGSAAQAFADYNYDKTAGRIEYTPGVVQPKYFLNHDTFKPGYVTPDDGWDNYWRHGTNRLLGWERALPAAGTARSPWARNSPAATPSRAARSRRSSGPSACVRRATLRTGAGGRITACSGRAGTE